MEIAFSIVLYSTDSFSLDVKIIFFTITNIFARQWTLRQLGKMIQHWSSDVVDLPEIVARTKLFPGAKDIIQVYKDVYEASMLYYCL